MMRNQGLLRLLLVLSLPITYHLSPITYSYAQETLTITTYYPSPYGSYKELTAHRMKIGTTYSGSGVSVADNNLLVEGNVGIGTTTPQNRLDVEGGAVVGATYSGTNTAPANGLLVEGNVGIGTNSPASKLDIRGANAKATTAAFENIIQAASTDAANPLTLRLGIKTDAVGMDRYGAIEVDDAGTKRNLVLQPSGGNVGIGTVGSPNEQLEITRNFRLPYTTGATVGVIYSGANRYIHNYGTDNFFAGVNAGNFTMTGSSNTAYGIWTLYANTTGYANTANGKYVLRNNTTGYANTANGAGALYSNTTGNNNTANGSEALRANTTGYNNTANGLRALYFNTTGHSNIANGVEALRANTTGYLNTANGYRALYFNTTGYYNTANGMCALYSNTTGDRNTANGANALYSNTTGRLNTVNGNSALCSNTTGDHNTANGNSALSSNTTGSQNSAMGLSALYSNTTGNYNTALGFSADVSTGNLTNATAIGNNATVNASNKVRIGNDAVTVIGGVVGWSNESDRRLKEDIIDYVHGLDFITKLRPVEFKFKSDATHKLHSGFIAQEVEAIGIPFYGINKPENKDSYYELTYAEFVVPLVNAVKELKAENNKLKANNDDFRVRIEKLEAKNQDRF